ncbi:hypothetical protein [Mongoliitalea daihaiensis]|uniref:hypothetical protein n=1 Tax=Mongoliitalea daihaiensis TaxID=2782006 RepID=UPI001F229D32|nr:hypothetical protein [Mongoliitalea daihaiensis]UJP64573.1 hypothetical protein IPZ59_17485 [Mongoliitalea daihaiensis]
MLLPKQSAKGYCVLANTSKSIHRILNSLNSLEFECLGIFVLNDDTPDQLNSLARVPDVLFMENCEEAIAVKSLFKMQYNRTSIVYLEQRDSMRGYNPPELAMGETILLI